MRRFALFTWFFAASIALAAGAARAEYPDRPVRLVVPYPAGGPTDLTARLVAEQLSKRLQQQFIVDNRGGAGGNLGAEMAAKAPPDGYTLVMIGAAHAINVTLYPKLSYDVRRDFAPVALLTVAPMVVITNAAFPPRTLPELVALARQQPGKIAYASAGNGTAPHLAMELLKSQSGADLLHVPYRGSAPGMADVLAGQVPVTVDSIVAALQNVGSGKLRLLAVTGAQRSPMTPDVPTVGEAGYPGAQSLVWYGIAAPAQTPPAIVARLNEEIGKVLADPEIRKRLADFGAEPSPMAPGPFGAFIAAEIDKWAAAVKSSGARID